MTQDELNHNETMMHSIIPNIREILLDYVLCAEQVYLLDNFCTEMLAIQDAEYNHRNNKVWIEDGK